MLQEVISSLALEVDVIQNKVDNAVRKNQWDLAQSLMDRLDMVNAELSSARAELAMNEIIALRG